VNVVEYVRKLESINFRVLVERLVYGKGRSTFESFGDSEVIEFAEWDRCHDVN
jgi:hypothetical protein